MMMFTFKRLFRGIVVETTAQPMASMLDAEAYANDLGDHWYVGECIAIYK